jgi:RimJ/RimL family protein N-acetyltransferase
VNPFARLRRAFVRRRCVIVELNRVEDLVDAPPPTGVAVRVVTADDVDRVRAFRDDAVAAEFRRLLAAGDRGVDAWVDGRVVAHLFAAVCAGPRRRMWGGVDLVRGDALFVWGNVREDLRGRGILQAMIRELVRVLFREAGVRRVVGDPPADLPASIRAHVNCGFRVAGELSYVSFADVMLRRRWTPAP